MTLIRSQEDQLRDIREATESGFAVVHIDTCHSCYLQDHHNRDGELLLGVYVDGETTIGQVLDELDSEFNQIGWDLASERKGYDDAKAQAAFAKLRADNTDRLGQVFDDSLYVPTEEERDDMSLCEEPTQAWFLLTWDVPEDEEEETS